MEHAGELQPKLRQDDTNSRAQAYVVALALVATLVVNVLANLLPLNGRTTGAVAQGFQELFRPAAYVFSIWSFIYAGLIAFSIFQLLPKERANARLNRIRAPFLWSCAANMAWLFLWHYELFAATLIAMAALLVALVVINQRLHWGSGEQKVAELLCVEAPFRIYLAWVSVASLANVSLFVEAARLLPSGVSLEQFAIALVLLATAISTAVGLLRHDALYLAVVIWAFVGIAVRNGQTSPVSGVAMAGVLILGAVSIQALLWNRSHGAAPGFHRAGTAT